MKTLKFYRQEMKWFFDRCWRLLLRKARSVIENHKYRARLCAGTLLLAALGLGFAIAGAMFGPGSARPAIGAFFADSYGAISFIIPLYLVYAASVLLERRYKPARIFMLFGAIFPFMTLAIGFSFLRAFDFFSHSIKLLSVFSKTGFSFIIVALTVIETAVIFALSTVLFPPSSVRRPPKPAPKPAPKPSRAASLEPARAPRAEVRLLSSPLQAAPTISPPTGVFAGGIEKSPSVSESAQVSPAQVSPAKVSPAQVSLFRMPFGARKAEPDAASRLQKEAEENDDAIGAMFSQLEPTLDLLNKKLEALDAKKAEVGSKADTVASHLAALESEVFNEVLNIEGNIEAAPLSEARSEIDPRAFEAEADDEADGEAASLLFKAEASRLALPLPVEASERPREVKTYSFADYLRQQSAAQADSDTSETPAAATPASETPVFADIQAEAEASVSKTPVSKPQAVPHPVGTPAFKAHYSVPVDMLNKYTDDKYWIIDSATNAAAAVLKETLNEFNIQAEVTGIRKGPVITMFEILPSPGVKLSKIVNLQDNIALRLAASSVRIVAPIPGKHAVGIEIPNKIRNIVSFREIIEAEMAREGKKAEIPVVLGKDITGEAMTVDLASMPHLLIAGATGAGKSVCVNTMILSILYQCKPAQCRLILIDPKIVELKLYNDIPHLLTPVITEPKRAFQALQYCIYEMERRYACLDSMGVRDIKTYNRRIKEKKMAAEHMPYIVVVIDEFADLMATTGKELESTVARLAAMSRAVGIHLVLATQRPSIDVITGLIKSNIPSRIAFMVASMMDSRIIIDTPGAEKLLGKGDMLYSGIVDPFPVRMQGAFVSEEEVEAVVAHVKTLGGPDYIDEEIFFDDDEAAESVYTEGDDPLYDKALDIVTRQGKASASYIQRRLKIGYNRAARLLEEMEQRGVVGPAQGSKPRDILRAV